MAQAAAARLRHARKELAPLYRQGSLADIFAIDSTTDFSFVDFASRSIFFELSISCIIAAYTLIGDPPEIAMNGSFEPSDERF